MVVAAPLAKAIPLATLSAVLLMVAWNMSEVDHFRSLLRSPRSDVLVLLTTFGLTVFTDLTISVAVGMVLASMLFMRRMTEIYGVRSIKGSWDNDEDDDEEPFVDLPPASELQVGIEIYEINGPFFFGVADRLKDALAEVERPPHTFILRMRHVPAIDSTGLHALEEFHTKCSRSGTRLILSGLQPAVHTTMQKIGLAQKIGEKNLCTTINEAIQSASLPAN
jgi:SulP family sulfate permease